MYCSAYFADKLHAYMYRSTGVLCTNRSPTNESSSNLKLFCTINQLIRHDLSSYTRYFECIRSWSGSRLVPLGCGRKFTNLKALFVDFFAANLGKLTTSIYILQLHSSTFKHITGHIHGYRLYFIYLQLLYSTHLNLNKF